MSAADAPPVVGIGAQLTFAAFLVVLLVVPFVMAGDQFDAPRDAEGGRWFTSARERRLWILAAAVLTAIWVTLGPVAEWAAWLRARNLLRITGAGVLALVVAALVVPWLRQRPGSVEVAAAIGVAAVYLTTMIRIPVPEARSHLFEYGVVAVLLYQALRERRRNGRRVPAPAWIALITAVVLGWFDELLQFVVPNRSYDLVDVGFNALAALMAIVALKLMAWARSWDIFAQRGG